MACVALTGAKGFIGTHVATLLARSEYQLVDLDRAALRQDDETLIDRMKNCDAFVHMAGRAHRSRRDQRDEDSYFQDNVQLTERVLELAQRAGIKRFIFLSTIGVHGSRTTDKPFRETDTPNPHNVYTLSKFEAEKKVIDFCQMHNMEWVILRPPLVCGKNAPGNIGRLQRMLRLKLPLPFAGIRNKRSLICVENLADIIRHCITARQAANQIYLVSDGLSRSTPELLHLLAELDELNARLFPFPQFLLRWSLKLLGREQVFSPLWDNLEVDASKLSAQLDWQPQAR